MNIIWLGTTKFWKSLWNYRCWFVSWNPPTILCTFIETILLEEFLHQNGNCFIQGKLFIDVKRIMLLCWLLGLGVLCIEASQDRGTWLIPLNLLRICTTSKEIEVMLLLWCMICIEASQDWGTWLIPLNLLCICTTSKEIEVMLLLCCMIIRIL